MNNNTTKTFKSLGWTAILLGLATMAGIYLSFIAVASSLAFDGNFNLTATMSTNNSFLVYFVIGFVLSAFASAQVGSGIVFFKFSKLSAAKRFEKKSKLYTWTIIFGVATLFFGLFALSVYNNLEDAKESKDVKAPVKKEGAPAPKPMGRPNTGFGMGRPLPSLGMGKTGPGFGMGGKPIPSLGMGGSQVAGAAGKPTLSLGMGKPGVGAGMSNPVPGKSATPNVGMGKPVAGAGVGMGRPVGAGVGMSKPTPSVGMGRPNPGFGMGK